MRLRVALLAALAAVAMYAATAHGAASVAIFTQVARLKMHSGRGAGALHLPAWPRAGKRRLTKGHYVLGMSAIAGTQSAAASLELIVK
jgi:hypothetical protein